MGRGSGVGAESGKGDSQDGEVGGGELGKEGGSGDVGVGEGKSYSREMGRVVKLGRASEEESTRTCHFLRAETSRSQAVSLRAMSLRTLLGGSRAALGSVSGGSQIATRGACGGGQGGGGSEEAQVKETNLPKTLDVRSSSGSNSREERNLRILV